MLKAGENEDISFDSVSVCFYDDTITKLTAKQIGEIKNVLKNSMKKTKTKKKKRWITSSFIIYLVLSIYFDDLASGVVWQVIIKTFKDPSVMLQHTLSSRKGNFLLQRKQEILVVGSVHLLSSTN